MVRAGAVAATAAATAAGSPSPASLHYRYGAPRTGSVPYQRAEDQPSRNHQSTGAVSHNDIGTVGGILQHPRSYGTIPPASSDNGLVSDHDHDLEASRHSENSLASSHRGHLHDQIVPFSSSTASSSHRDAVHRQPGTHDDEADDGSCSDADDDDLPAYPTYSSFRNIHYLLDLPITLCIIVTFALISHFGWKTASNPSRLAYPHALHWRNIGVGAVFWIASEAIRKRMFKWAARMPLPSILKSTAVLLLAHTIIQEALRVFAIYITFFRFPASASLGPSFTTVLLIDVNVPVPHPRPPRTFFTVFDLALGFAAAETLWRTLELLGCVSLYADVLDGGPPRAWLVGEENIVGLEDGQHGCLNGETHLVDAFDGGQAKTSSPDLSRSDSNAESAESRASAAVHVQIPMEDDENAHPVTVDDGSSISSSSLDSIDVAAYLREKKRLEIEEAFGSPLWDIPIVIVAVWRLDAMLLNLALTLLMALPFYRNGHAPRRHSPFPIYLPFWPTFLFVILLHWTLSLIWTVGMRAGRRRECGMPVISYGTLLAVLACFFASLAGWGALV